MTEPTMERQVAEILRNVEVGFARSDGKLDLLTQQLGHQAEASAQLSARVEKLDGRVDSIERTAVTRPELEQLRNDLESKVGAVAQERAADHKAVTGARRAALYAFAGSAVLALLMLLITLALKPKGG